MALIEEEAEYVLKGIIDREQQRLQTILTPYFEELTHIMARKPPRPVQLPNGGFAVYKGPSADDLGGPYRAPEWLERMCKNFSAESDDLRRFREHNPPPDAR